MMALLSTVWVGRRSAEVAWRYDDGDAGSSGGPTMPPSRSRLDPSIGIARSMLRSTELPCGCPLFPLPGEKRCRSVCDAYTL